MPESLSLRPYLTCAEAATYCGFKTIGGIQQAVRRGKLKPAGRRGGTGTYVFAREDLDAFLTGGLQPHERLFVSPEQNQAAGQAPSPKAPGRTPRRPPAPAAPPAPRPQSADRGSDRSPRETPIHGGAAASANRKSGQGHGKGQGKSPAVVDPVARIMAALSGPTKKAIPKPAKAQVASVAGKNQAARKEKFEKDGK